MSTTEAITITEHNISDFLKMGTFFKEFAPGVANPWHKRRGKDGNGKPLTFSETDQQEIKKAAYKLATALLYFSQSK